MAGRRREQIDFGRENFRGGIIGSFAVDGYPSALKLPSWRIWTDYLDLICSYGCQFVNGQSHCNTGWAYENIKTLYIDPGCPWQNGYVESFHDKFRRESLARELFYTLSEAQVVIAAWRKKFNQIRPPTQLPPLPNIQLHRPA